MTVEPRPWGTFIVLGRDEGWWVKELSILPGRRTSLQSHRWRSEVWHIVQGQATVTISGKSILAHTGQLVIVSSGEVHRLANQGEDVLRVVEVATGIVCDELDVVRLEDDYARVN